MIREGCRVAPSRCRISSIQILQNNLPIQVFRNLTCVHILEVCVCMPKVCIHILRRKPLCAMGATVFSLGKGEYASPEWTGVGLGTIKQFPYMEGLVLLLEYGDGVQVRGWEVVTNLTPPDSWLASSHCVLHLNLIKGSFNIVIYTHTHILTYIQ